MSVSRWRFEKNLAQNWSTLGYYGAISGNFLTTFRDNLSVPSSRFKTPFLLDSWTLRMGPSVCPKTSLRNYHYSPHNDPEESSSQLLRGGSLKPQKKRLRIADENCVLLDHYAASSGNFFTTFRDNLSVLSSRTKHVVWSLTLEFSFTCTILDPVPRF